MYTLIGSNKLNDLRNGHQHTFSFSLLIQRMHAWDDTHEICAKYTTCWIIVIKTRTMYSMQISFMYAFIFFQYDVIKNNFILLLLLL